MTVTYAKMISLVVGYLLGCFLTAEIVAHKITGGSASKLGDTGNPGMANIMASLGFVPGIVTLAGDLGKCLLAALLSWLFFRDAGWIVTLYAGLGCTLGHIFPFWRRFHGGKGVATISMAVVIYSFPWGLAANIFGMLTVFATQYLCIGGPVIPGSFALIMWLRGQKEAAAIGLVMTLLSLVAHGSSIRGIKAGKTKKNDVLGAIKKKLQK